MLILITGVTGVMGHLLTTEALQHGHMVRGLGRTRSKMSQACLNESNFEFVQTSSYFDEGILKEACRGCDAVICAYGIVPQLQLEAQLLLLRTAEECGVQRFIANSWSGDYRRLKLGDMETYDPYICFRAQSQLESSIKANYIFVGVFAETMFNDYHPGPEDTSVWVRSRDEVLAWGTGSEPLTITPMRDAASYTIKVLERSDSVDGGDWYLSSFRGSLHEMVETYNAIGIDQKRLIIQGSIEDLRKVEHQKRLKGSKLSYWEYLPWTYWLNLLEGRMEGATDDRSLEFAEECRTSLTEWFRQWHV